MKPLSEVFEFERTVGPGDTDSLGHVNNQVYLDWFMDAATRHSAAVGWGLPRMIAEGEGWVVRRHELDYLAQLLPGDKVLIRTWIESAEKASSVRRYEVLRPADGRVASAGLTVWVWIKYATGRPSRIPAALVGAFAGWRPAGAL
jgi:acyl-CoA thioester hydrolase